MAGIDKIYTSNYQEYKELKDWFYNHSFLTPRGIKVDLRKYVYDREEEDFFKEDGSPREVPIACTPLYVDRWLLDNCSLPIITNYLKYVGTSKTPYNDFNIKSIPCTKVKIKHRGGLAYDFPLGGSWLVSVEYDDGICFYNKDYNLWITVNECEPFTSPYYCHKGSLKALIRKVLKVWKLPKGCEINVKGRYFGDTYTFVTK